MILGISLFFQWFGVLAFIGSIALFVMVRKVLKKEMPTEQEKQELIISGKVNSTCKKNSIWRSETQKLRYRKQVLAEVSKELERIALEQEQVKAENAVESSK